MKGENMYCPHCGNTKNIVKNGFIEIDAMTFNRVNMEILTRGSDQPLMHCKYWFQIEKQRCLNCGKSFWLQNEEV